MLRAGRVFTTLLLLLSFFTGLIHFTHARYRDLKSGGAFSQSLKQSVMQPDLSPESSDTDRALTGQHHRGQRAHVQFCMPVWIKMEPRIAGMPTRLDEARTPLPRLSRPNFRPPTLLT